MMQATSGCRARISRHTSIPLPSGRGRRGRPHRDRGRYPSQGLSHRPRFADHRQAVGLEQATDPVAHDLMVVEQEDAHGHTPV